MPYIPEPTLGQLVLDKDGERWVVCSVNRRSIGLQPTYDNPNHQVRHVSKKTWRQGFLYHGWLMV